MENIEAVVDAPILVGSLITSKGRARAIMGGAVAGAIGGAAARVAVQMAGERGGTGSSPLPSFAFAIGYVAVTAEEIVLVAGRQGLIGPKAERVVARVSRTAAVAAELGTGTLVRPLKVSFDNGDVWELEVPRANTKHIEAVLSELSLS